MKKLLRREIEFEVNKAIRKISQKKKNFNYLLSISSKKEFGDFTINAPFLLANELRKRPKVIGEELKKVLASSYLFKKIDFVLPGYINLFINDKVLIQNLNFDPNLITKEKEKKYYLEYISANPTGILHLGHMRIGLASRIYGKLVEFLGNKVYKEFLVNDGGEQLTVFQNSIQQLIDSNFKDEKVTYFSQEMKNIAYNVKLGKVKLNKNSIVESMLKEIKKDMELLKINPNEINFINEKDFASQKKSDSFYKNLLQKNICYLDLQAIYIKTTNIGDDKDRVVVKSNGDRTYVGTDILYHLHKFKTKSDQYVNFWGADQQGNEKTLRFSLKLLNKSDEQKLVIVYSQLVHLKKDGKIERMSKRKGTNVNVRDLNKVIDIDTVSHYMMSKSLNTTLALDLNELREKNKNNTLYYLQYTFARICQLEKKAQKEYRLDFKNKLIEKNVNLSINEKRLIILSLDMFQILKDVGKSFEIHRLYQYLYNLCEMFHYYYQNERILPNNNTTLEINKSILKLKVAKLVKKVIATMFDILSIDKIQKMEKLN